MLEKIPHGVGRVLRGLRAGFEKVASERRTFSDVPDVIDLRSPAFEDGGSLQPRFTADGEGLSPPLSWAEVPAGTQALALLVEDPDAPTPTPLVHLLVWDLPPHLDNLPEGQFASLAHEGLVAASGGDAYQPAAWLPPDPPPGHGPHLYVFQLFALDTRLSFDRPPGRSAFLAVIEGHVLAKGMLIATYARA